jgi:opacity protein-like surface antigen
MTSRITKTVALAALMAGAAGVANATEGWYGRGDVGYSFDGEIDVNDDYANYTFGDSTLEHDWSQHLGLGYAFQNGFRLEGELGHRFNQIEPTPTIDAGGDVHAWSAMANLFYDFNRGGRLEPYIGVGVGAARLNYNVNDLHSSTIYAEGEDTVLAYQGLVGFAVGLGEQWDLDIGYRYFIAEGAEGDGSRREYRFGRNDPPFTTDADYEHQALTVGLRYQFGAPAPPPPPPPPAAAAATAAAASGSCVPDVGIRRVLRVGSLEPQPSCVGNHRCRGQPRASVQRRWHDRCRSHRHVGLADLQPRPVGASRFGRPRRPRGARHGRWFDPNASARRKRSRPCDARRRA